MRPPRPPHGGAWAGPQIPARLLHPFSRIVISREFRQEEGGVYKRTRTVTSGFMGVILPINNKDLQLLPEGSSTVDTQKIYTNGDILEVGQLVLDSQDNQIYTVITELSHNSLHGLKRYIVTRRGESADGG